LPAGPGTPPAPGGWHELGVADDFTVCFVPSPGRGTSRTPSRASFAAFSKAGAGRPGRLLFRLGYRDPLCWSFFEGWTDHGIALVQDMWDPGMLPTHLFKRRWRAHAERLGYECRDVAAISTAGSPASDRADIGFLRDLGGLIKSTRHRRRRSRSHQADDPNHILQDGSGRPQRRDPGSPVFSICG